MTEIDPSKTPKDYLEKFYNEYNLGEDGGNHLPYVILEIFGWFKVYIPNWDNRRKAVLRHDIHHLLTGYRSVMQGEFQIAAWEIASGCLNYPAAYLLNSGGLLMGMLIYFIPTYKAFVLGSHSSNLYQLNLSDQELKNTTIMKLKKKIGFQTDSISKFELRVFVSLILHLVFSFIINCLVLLILPFLFLYNLYMYIKIAFK